MVWIDPSRKFPIWEMLSSKPCWIARRSTTRRGFKKILEKARVREFACKTRYGSATSRKADHSSRRIRRIDLDHVGAAGAIDDFVDNHAPATSHEEKKSEPNNIEISVRANMLRSP
jgi:hypothetical protein